MTTTESWHSEPPTFFTWFDVEQWFRDLAAEGEWPEWLLEVDAYWDSLELTLDQQVTFGQVWDYLGDTLGRLTIDREAERLLLEDGGVAGGSGLDVVLTDRLLTPTSMRRALPACSRQKIEAIEQEIFAIEPIFTRMRTLDHEGRKVPFRREDIGLGLEDVTLLESIGAVFLVENEYWMPEIYRHGLNFKATRRPRVLGVAKLVRGSSPGGAGRR